MRRTIRNLSILTVLSLLVGSAFAGASPSAPAVKEDARGIVLSNDLVSFSFLDKKPVLVVRAAGNETDAFTYTFDQLVEYRDVDANGLPSDNEVVARLDLAAASYQVNQTTKGDAVVLNLTLTAPVKPTKTPAPAPGGVLDNLTLPNGDAQVTLLFTLRNTATTLKAGAASLTIPASAVKYDLFVTKWPFIDSSMDRLALDMHASGVGEQAPGVGVESAVLARNGTQVGAVSWSTLARGATPQGATIDVPVRAVLKVQPSANGTSETRIVYTYDAADVATLVHEATIGLASASIAEISSSGSVVGPTKDTPGAGVVAALGALAVVGLLSRRRT
ncbi:MAG: hypothetical protein WDA16_10295 [Candidatus Thermoplasmatota archaeon]